MGGVLLWGEEKIPSDSLHWDLTETSQTSSQEKVMENFPASPQPEGREDKGDFSSLSCARIELSREYLGGEVRKAWVLVRKGCGWRCCARRHRRMWRFNNSEVAQVEIKRFCLPSSTFTRQPALAFYNIVTTRGGCFFYPVLYIHTYVKLPRVSLTSLVAHHVGKFGSFVPRIRGVRTQTTCKQMWKSNASLPEEENILKIITKMTFVSQVN